MLIAHMNEYLVPETVKALKSEKEADFIGYARHYKSTDDINKK